MNREMLKIQSYKKRLRGKTICIRRQYLSSSWPTLTYGDDKEQVFDVESIAVGDFLIVRSGERFPTDGVLINGVATIDESELRGKSIPLEKRPGERVYEKSLNMGEDVEYQVTKVGIDTSYAKMCYQVKELQKTKGAVRETKGRIKQAAVIGVPIVLVLAFVTIIVWFSGGAGIERTIPVVLSVLIIACFCALGLIPLANISIMVKKARKEGVLIKNGRVLEAVHDIDVVLLDKTGTVTKGVPVVTDVRPLIHISQDKLLQIAASAEVGLGHPLGVTIVKAAESAGLEMLEREECSTRPGHGIRAILQGKSTFIGNENEMKANGYVDKEAMEIGREYVQEGKEPIFVVYQEQIAGLICVADTMKETTCQLVEQLTRHGIEVVMVTGDNENIASVLAKEAGITSFRAELSSEGKGKVVEEYQEQGKKVLMIGDGINDAVAMVKADAGIAICSENDMVVSAADVLLSEDNLMRVMDFIKLGRSVQKNIKCSIFCNFYSDS